MKLRQRLLFAGLILTATGLMVAVLIPDVRLQVQAYWANPGRELLATAEGDLLNDGSQVKVLKYREGDRLYVEINKEEPSGDLKRIELLLLPDSHDGFFNFHGHITRLAIADVDHTGGNKLIAPSFDNQLVPHLNVFRYNSDLGRFEPYQPTK